MKLLIVTPLYPPDIAPLAVYVKEFARRMSPTSSVTVLAYAHIPEEIPSVRIGAVPKDKPLLIRLFNFTRALLREAQDADVLFIQNGASVELPATLVSFFIKIPLIVQLSDRGALTLGMKRTLFKTILRLMLVRATHIIHEEGACVPISYPEKTTCIALPSERPEIFSFKPYPTEAFAQYEQSWKNHLKQVISIFSHAK